VRQISRKEELVTVTFGDEEDGNEVQREFLLREMSVAKAGRFLAALDLAVQASNSVKDGELVPTADRQRYLFQEAARSLDHCLLTILSRPRGDVRDKLSLSDIALISEGQRQDLIALQCDLNRFDEECMGKVSRLLVTIHAIRLAGVMIEHLEAETSSPETSSTLSPELTGATP